MRSSNTGIRAVANVLIFIGALTASLQWREALSAEVAGTLTIHVRHSGTSSSCGSGSDYGHAWISYTPVGGETHTYGTWGIQVYDLKDFYWRDTGLQVDIEKHNEYPSTSSRSVLLNQEQYQELAQLVIDYQNMGEDAWSALNNCSSFASEAWNAATMDENHLSAGSLFDHPDFLEGFILDANDGTTGSALTYGALEFQDAIIVQAPYGLVWDSTQLTWVELLYWPPQPHDEEPQTQIYWFQKNNGAINIFLTLGELTAFGYTGFS